MSATSVRRGVVLTIPALALAAAGLFHPHHLDYSTSWTWFVIHVAGLVLFPLVGLALAGLVRARRDGVAWVVRLTAYVYATFYTALDVISGLAAGWVTHRLGPGAPPRTEEVRLLFAIGTPLGQIGSWALVLCALLLAVDQVVRHRAIPAVALLPGALLVHIGHIFAPVGVVGMALLALGTGWVAAREHGGAADLGGSTT